MKSTIKTEINKALLDREMCASEMQQTLETILGCKLDFYDSCIDDGLDGDGEETDNYLLKACFSTPDGDRIIVYYGNVTECIGCIEFHDAPEKESFPVHSYPS